MSYRLRWFTVDEGSVERPSRDECAGLEDLPAGAAPVSVEDFEMAADAEGEVPF